MRIRKIYILLILILSVSISFSQEDVEEIEIKTVTSSKDTAYNYLATTKILNMLLPGQPPPVTLQLSFSYNVGHLDLAANENTSFRKDDFVGGANFGTRYGYSIMLTGKIAMHKEGNVRLNINTGYSRISSNFIISETPEGKVAYNVFSFGVGVENNFTPQKRFKPYIGLDLVLSAISGNATLATDSTDFALKINSATRFGISFGMGFEYAFNDKVGMNFGYKLTHANMIGKDSKESANVNETYLNDNKLNSGQMIQYAGWKQFLYSSLYAGVNFYFGMKNKK